MVLDKKAHSKNQARLFKSVLHAKLTILELFAKFFAENNVYLKYFGIFFGLFEKK